jgi:hypothetical protein
MCITFSSETVARSAAKIFEEYGYAAHAVGTVVTTDCPPLLAVPVVGRAIGLHQVEDVRLGALSVPPRGDRSTSAAA